MGKDVFLLFRVIFMSLKRFFSIVVLLAYFTVTSGFAVSLHYCMDELSGIELGTESADTCPKCGMEAETAPGGCCRDEVKLVQQKGDPAAVASLDFELAQVQAAALPAGTYAPLLFLPEAAPLTASIRPPPLLGGYDLYLALCTFRL